MAKDTQTEGIPVTPPIYVLAYKEGRRLFHTEFHDKMALEGRIILLMARKIEFRVEYREQTEEEKQYYASL